METKCDTWNAVVLEVVEQLYQQCRPVFRTRIFLANPFSTEVTLNPGYSTQRWEGACVESCIDRAYAIYFKIRRDSGCSKHSPTLRSTYDAR